MCFPPNSQSKTYFVIIWHLASINDRSCQKGLHSSLMRVSLYQNIPPLSQLKHFCRHLSISILSFPGAPDLPSLSLSLILKPTLSQFTVIIGFLLCPSPQLSWPTLPVPPLPYTHKPSSQIKLNTILAKVCTCFF